MHQVHPCEVFIHEMCYIHIVRYKINHVFCCILLSNRQENRYLISQYDGE